MKSCISDRYKSLDLSFGAKRVWNLPQVLHYEHEVFREYDYDLYVYDPCFLPNKHFKYRDEEFAKFLEQNTQNIQWWYRNKFLLKSDFYILSSSGKKTKLYPDCMVNMKDGYTGIFYFDDAYEDIHFCAKELQKYIIEEKMRGKKVFGGIITMINNSFWINQSMEYEKLEDKGIVEENSIQKRVWKKLKTVFYDESWKDSVDS